MNTPAVASFLWLVFSATLVLAAAPAPEPAPPANSPEIAVVVKAENAFAVDLYQQLASQNDGQAVLIAPLSIGTALTMATEGAVAETADQMLKTLHLPAGKLDAVHRGHAALTKRLVPPADPPALAAKIGKLRKDLDVANAKVQGFINANKYNEAQQASVPAEKIAAELNALLQQTRPYELQIANALWAEQTYPFSKDYLAALQPNYGATFFPMDFRNNAEGGRKQINAWVEKNTNNRIKDLIGDGMLDKLTRLVITNSVFFQGEWEEPFEKSSTQKAEFQVNSKQKKQVSLMSKWHPAAGYAAFKGDGSAFKTPREIPIDMSEDDLSLYPAGDGYVVLSLPYRGDKLAMSIVLPRSVEGLAALEKKLSAEAIASWSHGETRSVYVHLPRFKIEAEYGLNQSLKELGIVRAFKDTVLPDGAQFDKMTSDKAPEHRLYISAVIHKTYLEVNEKGTEAAAASAVIFAAPLAAPFDRDVPKTKPFTPTFKADHPYLCLIQDPASGAVLFMGRVLEPKE